jgi:hypothetical protein
LAAVGGKYSFGRLRLTKRFRSENPVHTPFTDHMPTELRATWSKETPSMQLSGRICMLVMRSSPNANSGSAAKIEIENIAEPATELPIPCYHPKVSHLHYRPFKKSLYHPSGELL